MSKQFTASDKKPLFESDVDPKRIKSVADGLRRQGEVESARMLDGYADMLTAHSAQAPPPAASVPDAETLRLHLGELTPDEVCVAKAAYRLALAAQENPNG